jgi:hypothetical protein
MDSSTNSAATSRLWLAMQDLTFDLSKGYTLIQWLQPMRVFHIIQRRDGYSHTTEDCIPDAKLLFTCAGCRGGRKETNYLFSTSTSFLHNLNISLPTILNGLRRLSN